MCHFREVVIRFKFIDLFAGVGGFRLGMELAGHEAVGWCEIDKYAQRSYRAIYETEGGWFADDIQAVRPEELPEADCYTAGFPCQSFSIAGRRGGFEDTRGTLFFDILRLAKERRPQYILLENVSGLLSHDGGKTFGTILTALAELGYSVEWQVLNSKNFGVPQNRERVFIVGHLGGLRGRQVFPITGESGRNPKELTKGMSQGYRVYNPEGSSITLAGEAGGLGAKTGLYAVKPCLTPERTETRQQGRRFKDNEEPMFTLTGQDVHGVAIDNGKLKRKEISTNIDANCGKGLDNHQARTGIKEEMRIRKLTPRECWRLQGFPDWAFEKAAEVNSDTQLYKQAGNGVTVNVVYEIAKRLKEV